MRIALVGNQNSGKTSLFNVLTGSTQKVGNWPGVTLEQKTGTLRKTGDHIVDLPGIYSLSPYSLEENVSRDYLVNEKPDLIINIIDATNLERSLYLTSQLLELNINVVIALNMMDILKKEGSAINIEKLSKTFNTTIIPISARKREGIDDLVASISNGDYIRNGEENLYVYQSEVSAIMRNIRRALGKEATVYESVKVFERDASYVDEAIGFENDIQPIEAKYKMDSEEIVADQRYAFIEKSLNGCVIITSKRKNNLSTKLDKVLLNKWACFPIFILIMAIVYFIAIGLMGTIPLSFIDVLFNGDGGEGIAFNFEFIGIDPEIFETVIPFHFEGFGPLVAEGIVSLGGSEWAADLIATGVIGGFGAIFTFVPQLAVLFFFLAILESSGYMSRIAFALDRVFRYFGLNGQSVISFIVGTGCGVPGIMACKTIEDQEERKTTAIVTTFMPCGAKLPIIALIVGGFFGSFGWLITLGMYFIAIVSILAVSIFLKKIIYKVKGEKSSYISELPTYKAPMMSYVFRDTGMRLWDFIKKAGTIIVASSIVIWFLVSFTWDMRYVDNEAVHISESILAGIGHALSWIFVPMMSSSMVYGGASYSDLWSVTVSAVQGLVAKENVVVAMRTIAELSDDLPDAEMFTTGAFGFMNGWTAFSFMLFNLFSTPCFAAVGALKRELGNSKEWWKAIGIQMGFAWSLSAVVGVIGLGVMAIIGG